MLRISAHAITGVSSMTSTLPEWLGEFRVADLLRKGAMSEIYRGFSREGRAVAIKVLEAGLKGDADAAARFTREAEALKKIRDPHVAELIEFGTAPDGRPYLICELVEGPTLKEIIDQRERADLLKGLDWMEEAAEALQEAWHHKIIHRDIKPENLMINAEGELKVVDFGLSKVVFSDAEMGQGKAVLGTPRYMSPEMILGQGLDLRSDMYSLGATFFHYFTGESPFHADSHEEMMKRHAGSPPPPPHAIEPGLPEDICYILIRLMAKDPSGRYETYDDLIDHLRKTRLALMSREGALGGTSYGAPDGVETKAKPGETLDRPKALSRSEIAAEEERRRRALELVIDEPPASSRLFATLATLMAIGVVGWGVYLTYGSMRGGQGGSSPIRSAIDRVFGAFGAPGSTSQQGKQTWEENDPRTLESNMDRMNLVMGAIVDYRLANGYYPADLATLVQASMISPEEKLDMWGGEMEFLPAAGMLYSWGQDGAQYTPDDFKLNTEMQFLAKPRLPMGG